MDAIFPYVKSVQIYVCPSVTRDPDGPSYSYGVFSHPILDGANVAYADGHVKWSNIRSRTFQYGIAGPNGDWSDPVWNPFID
jgi:prepilin-type processing-associated H-X9-DG protein